MSPAARRLVFPLLLSPLAFTRAATAAPPAAPAPDPASVQVAQNEARRLSDAFVQVAEKTGPSVVQIEVTARDNSNDSVLRWLGRGGQGDSPIARGMGSGVLFTADGAILTNNHVIDDALSINVRFKDGRLVAGKLVGRDPSTDLAVVKVDLTGLPAARFADSDALRVGEWVVAIGSPFGLGYTVTAGVLSAKGRGGLGMNAIEDYLQTDASINPGNSGGPLCDLDGKVTGINTMIVGRGSGIGFAVPSNLARRVADQLLKTGHVQRAWIAAGVQELTPDLAASFKLDPRSGALLNSVLDGGPAQKANLKAGDVVTQVGGRAVHDDRDLVREILSHDVGQNVSLEVIREGKRYTTALTLTARPEAPVPPLPVQQVGAPQPGLGLYVRDMNGAQAAQLGLSKPVAFVSQVAPGSSADRAGLKMDDVIVEADGMTNPGSADVIKAAADGELLVRVKRRGATFYAALRK